MKLKDVLNILGTPLKFVLAIGWLCWIVVLFWKRLRKLAEERSEYYY